MSTPVILALTAGEPAGIGPELCLQLATGSRDAGLVVIASRELLRDRARQLGLQIELHDWQPGVAAATRAGHLSVRHVEGCGSTVAGRLDKGNSQYVLDTLTIAATKQQNAQTALANNDAHGFFGRTGGQVTTGPTLTNVNDFRAILVEAI